MVEPGHQLDLPAEPLGGESRFAPGVQHLEGHLPAVLEVLGEVDRGHAALAKLALEGVPAGEGRDETVRKAVHEFSGVPGHSPASRLAKARYRASPLSGSSRGSISRYASTVDRS